MTKKKPIDDAGKRETAQRILKQALVLFAKRGFDSTTMRDVSTSVGISLGLVTYHFPKKIDLFRAAITVPYDAFVGDLRRIVANRTRNPRERLLDLLERLASLSETEAQLVRAVFRELLTSPEHLSDLIGLFRSGHVLVVLTAIQDAVEDGVLPKGIGPGILPAIMGATVLPSVLAITLHQITPNVDFAQAILEGGHHDLALLLGLL